MNKAVVINSERPPVATCYPSAAANFAAVPIDIFKVIIFRPLFHGTQGF